MRYIRTEDRIYDGSLLLREYTGWYFHEKSKLYAFTEGDIFKQADTIEELCDGFVVINRFNKRKYLYSKKGFIKRVERNNTYNRDKNTYQDKLEHLLDYNTIYGAIWTDKGLIYVAKMNEKGELELL